MKTVHLQISGKVQGVFFRATAKEMAQLHLVSGWIKNTDDNNVEAEVTGENEAIEKFISWCKHGPAKAKVDHVKVTDVALKKFTSFEVIR